jgi:hypothetical protein
MIVHLRVPVAVSEHGQKDFGLGTAFAATATFTIAVPMVVDDSRVLGTLFTQQHTQHAVWIALGAIVVRPALHQEGPDGLHERLFALLPHDCLQFDPRRVGDPLHLLRHVLIVPSHTLLQLSNDNDAFTRDIFPQHCVCLADGIDRGMASQSIVDSVVLSCDEDHPR